MQTMSMNDESGKFTSFSERCPLCVKCKKMYHCKDCIRNGDFVYSSCLQRLERFADKKIRLFEITKERVLVLDRINVCIQRSLKMEELKSKILACQKNIKLLKLAVVETETSTSKIKTEIEWQMECIHNQNSKMPNRVKNNLKMHHHKEDCQRHYRNQLNKLDQCRIQLKDETRKNVARLVEHIFPITRVYPEDSQDDSILGETVSALAEASRTAYIKGRWVYMDNSGDMQYRIVEPMLPGSGDYSAYNVWVNSNRESCPAVASEFGHRNPGSAIGAALTYTCQFVSLLAFYLDIWLPKKLCYCEFSSHELSEPDFACKVAKLNANVLHLCLSQLVKPEVLHPKYTAANLLLLLDPKACDLGRYGPIEVEAEVMKLMEESLMHDMDRSGDETDDFDCSDDWETITYPPYPTSTSTMLYLHDYHLPGTAPVAASVLPEGATSMTSGLAMSAINSIASLFRGAFGTK